MPDNSDDTARVLCTGGTWLKFLDPAAADGFYKALVNRCRKTAIGAQADRMRWFPVLNENGNPKPWPPPAKTDNESGNLNQPGGTNGVGTVFNSEPQKSATYVVHAGDTLPVIARAAGVSLKALIEANTNLNPKFLRVGQLIFIPGPPAGLTNSSP